MGIYCYHVEEIAHTLSKTLILALLKGEREGKSARADACAGAGVDGHIRGDLSCKCGVNGYCKKH